MTDSPYINPLLLSLNKDYFETIKRDAVQNIAVSDQEPVKNLKGLKPKTPNQIEIKIEKDILIEVLELYSKSLWYGRCSNNWNIVLNSIKYNLKSK